MPNDAKGSLDKIFKSIPRTEQEMQEIRGAIDQSENSKIIEKAHKHNERIERCVAMVKMFQTDEFKEFWKVTVTEMKEMLTGANPIQSIKGSPLEGQRYDPFGQLVQLNIVQGGLDMLESMEMQKKIIEETAKGQMIEVEELQAKLKVLNNN